MPDITGVNLKNRCLFLLLFFALGSWLFAMGINEQEPEKEIQKDDWLLCITEFDSSLLSESKIPVANMIMKKLVESLDTISYRTRVSPEYAYYETAAWERARTKAAKALEAKQNERSTLLYRGDTGWRYRQNIKKIDNEINKLRLAFEEVDNDVPFVDGYPIFDLTGSNLDFEFPAPPKAGNEYKFCVEQKCDALLTGSVMEFHERFIVSWKLYTIYTRSFILEDSIIFSHNDLEKSMEEIMRRLIIVLSGDEPAVLTVRTEPEDTLVLINRSFAGRGETADLEYPPGLITVNASAPNYESLTFETELFPGEITDINIILWPIEYGDIEIFGTSTGNVYHGALYVGEAPLTLRLPVSQMEYIELKSEDTVRSTAVFQTPSESEFFNTISLHAKTPLQKGQVDKARRLYYWAWGGTWVAGISSWLTYYSFGFNGVTWGAISALGVTAIFDAILLTRYIYTANRGSTPAIKPGNN